MSETVVETPEIPAISQPLPRMTPFAASKEMAKAAQALATASRKRNKTAYLAKIEQLEAELNVARPIVDAATAKLATIAITDDEIYRLTQLARVREQIEQLWNDLDEAVGGKEIQSITTALEKLSNMEFSLSGRAKMGLIRPAKEKPTKSPQSSGPLED